ncbi:uncharacterized protein LOC143718561 [Siphateles boraxobius]|uniref:uncharacterized protein LOC143718561 n=1 Tax=Siphateles boraxobius TaxID=180520 RepID=UPI00406342B1
MSIKLRGRSFELKIDDKLTMFIQDIILHLHALSEDVSLGSFDEKVLESTVEYILERMGEISALTDTDVNNVAIANLREVLRQLQVQKVRRTPGRPSQNIPAETIETYLLRGIKAAEIARLFGVSEMTIRRRMREYGKRASDLYTDISNDDLDRTVAEIQNLYPNSGYHMMHGHLSSRGVKVQVERVRKSLRRVDPQGTQLRALSLRTIRRRQYSVPAPNAMWHIDGNHKLISFIEAVNRFGLPSRV